MPVFLLLGAMGLIYLATRQKSPQVYELTVVPGEEPVATPLLAAGPSRTEISGALGHVLGGPDLAAQAVLAAMMMGVEQTSGPRPHGGAHRGGGGHWRGGWGWGPTIYIGTDVANVCGWALTSASPATLRQLIAQYANNPAIVTCLSQRLAQLEGFGL